MHEAPPLVNLRKRSNVESSIINALMNGTSLTVLTEPLEPDGYQLVQNLDLGIFGWVHQAFLDFDIDEIAFFLERIRRRIRENENTLAIHPDPLVRRDTEVRLAAYRTVLDDAERLLA